MTTEREGVRKKPWSCSFGFHDFKVIKSCPCSAMVRYTLSGDTMRVNAVAVLEECKKCGKTRGYVTSGDTRSYVDVEYIKAYYIKE